MAGPRASSTKVDGDLLEQWNLRVPSSTKEFLEKLATAKGVRVNNYVLSILEDHVDSERALLAAIYQRDSERAAKTAAALDRRAAAAEQKNERAASAATRKVDKADPT